MSMKYATTGGGDLTSMIFSETRYLIYASASIITAILFSVVIILLARRFKIALPTPHRWRTIIHLVVLSLLFLWADRGFYLRYRTLEPRDTIISNNAFINKLGVNPIEPFVTSLGTASNTIELMDHDMAHDMVIEEMHRDNTFTEHVEAKPSPWRNVIIIFEESCTAACLTREGSTEALMPNLDRLIEEGLYFENTYSSGTHTCYAIYSLVTSLPGFVNKHPLQDGLERPLNTIFDQIYTHGDLKTLFYVTHGPNYDNVRSFLTTQGFERLMSRNNYGVETEKMWGVDDHIMFDFALNEIDAEWEKGNGVAAVLLTCSNHSPYDPPMDAGFTPTATDIESQAVEYADWAMNRFLDMAREREWFDDTLFIITGDHGRAITSDFEIPESLNHVPLLFYSPKHISPGVRSDLVAQMDIAPTVFSMLGMEYDNHTMGIDLNSDSRRMIPFGHDGHIAARDHNWLYIYDVHSDIHYLYNLAAEGDERLRNVAEEHPERVKDMHTYAAAMTQAGWDIPNAHTVWETTEKQ
jgi:phosphoglycerol transferase MdoB-like AlkP superfamily enzyme